MVRALASHQFCPGSIPGAVAICGLRLLLVLVFAPTVFLRFSDFPSTTKNDISKFKFDMETVEERPLCGCATEITINLLTYFTLFYCVRRRKDALLIQIGVEIVWENVY